MADLRKILSEADDTKVLFRSNGKNVRTFNDTVAVTNAKMVEEKAFGKEPDLGERELDENGNYKELNKPDVAIDPKTFFSNRFRYVDTVGEDGETEKTLEVVDDYRAIKEQPSGRIYTTHVTAYVLKRAKKGRGKGDLVLAGTKLIEDIDFIREFTAKLSPEAMIQVKQAITTGRSVVDADGVDIAI